MFASLLRKVRMFASLLRKFRMFANLLRKLRMFASLLRKLRMFASLLRKLRMFTKEIQKCLLVSGFKINRDHQTNDSHFFVARRTSKIITSSFVGAAKNTLEIARKYLFIKASL